MEEKSIIPIIFVAVIILIVILISFIAGIVFLYQKKQHAFVNQLEDVKDKYERELLKSQLEVQEQTLKNISREIHDNIGQFISLAKLHLNTVGPDIGIKSAEKVEYAVDLLSKAMDDLRDLSKSLSLELIRGVGLAKTIENQVNHLKKTERYDIDFEIRGNYNYLAEQKEIIIFRILQEAISNIIRHAQASKIKIVLDCTQDATSLSVNDNGKGFISENFLSNGKTYRHGGGITNMIYRAKLLDADLSVESKPGAGTLIRITLPFNQDADIN